MMTSELPVELLEEILCRVPATALKRLRTTCKQWNHLFNDKRFSRKHFDKAPKQLLLLTLSEKFRVCLLNINLHNGIPSAEVTGELNLNQVNIYKLSHSDGLLLCTIKGDDTRLILWNPCNGQIKWIQTPSKNSYIHDFVLGHCQENKSCDKSYKILGYDCFHEELKLFDINSNSWRNLGVTPIPNYHIVCSSDSNSMSLKGKTYWFAYDSKEEQFGLISFDYTRERFERLRLPYQCDSGLLRSWSSNARHFFSIEREKSQCEVQLCRFSRKESQRSKANRNLMIRPWMNKLIACDYQ